MNKKIKISSIDEVTRVSKNDSNSGNLESNEISPKVNNRNKNYKLFSLTLIFIGLVLVGLGFYTINYVKGESKVDI